MMNNEQNPQLTIPRVIGCLSFFNSDNLEIMRGFKDNEFDLAIVDPPYGKKPSRDGCGATKRKFSQRDNKWDIKPDNEYWNELFRISKNQIIWGANHLLSNLKETNCFIVWDKVNDDSVLADCELAWTSFSSVTKICRYMWNGMLQQNMKNKEERVHPTQKPIGLYDFIIKHYAKPNFKILDTHLGGGSIAIAVEKANRLDKMNLQFVGIEIDKEYYENALNRIEQYCRQGTLSF